ncbi:magnesium transporter [Corynebacterium auriscanis]|uniref:magnesium transporter n=1 Tax=Corynebacterium auriscanis TaxID=99807 RepID=UPI0009FC50C6|nr:magnesium transporter [Corynebacterium auriscanis]MCX2163784.1 magnesium transporter [Corynebacterium auriscanis]WJY72659.1 Magnesium transporter MgtE [Corynebacterium auriscanis]
MTATRVDPRKDLPEDRELPRLLASRDERELVSAQRWLAEQTSVDIAAELGRLKPELQAVAFRLLDKERALSVFEYLDPPHQADLLEALRDEHVGELFGSIAADDRAALLDEMPAKVASRLLRDLPQEDRRATSVLLGYPARSAGRAMLPVTVVLSSDSNREEALEKLQLRGEAFATVPVTDNSRRLIGMVNLADLVTAPAGTPVSDVLQSEKHRVYAHDDQEFAARLVQEADLLALPVVDEEDRLLGLLTVDDAMEILEDEETEDAYRSGGQEPLNEPYLTATVFTLARKRGLWLIVLIFAAFLTINVMEVFESTLEKVVVLSVFVPMIIGTGGNAGSQAASSVVRALAIDEVRPSDVFRVIWREVRVGFLLGVFLGAVIFPIVALLYYPQVAATISLAIVCICSWACIVGGMLPLVAKKLGVDPAVFSTPVVSTLVDATGLIIYFTIAGAIMAEQIAAAG